MEDDDEFGDLYTDVLTTFPSTSSFSAPPPPPPDSDAVEPPSSAPPRAIDLNLESQGTDDVVKSNFTTTSEKNDLFGDGENLIVSNSNTDMIIDADTKPDYNSVDSGSGARVSQIVDLTFGGDDSERGKENGEQLKEAIPEPVMAPETVPESGGGGVWEESDSDSEDDLQIVLNDSHHGPPPMGLDANGMLIGSDDEDEDGEPLVIVADEDAGGGLQPVEDQDWGDDAAQAAEPKDSTDGSKANAGISSGPKIGYSNYGYHPFHSQFKYVRPGAAPLPEGPPGVRPIVNINTLAGRGRGDWRPPGMKGPLSQKGFHPGFWGSSAPGRGLDFTLPSHKTIFEVDIDSFEEKPWKYPGVDLSDFFNFGLNEEKWKEYCKQLEQLRLESTMQSKIRVYESGRTEQEYDPDMPPELALAAGIHDSSAEIVDTAKVDGALGDLAKVSARSRPALPTGRAIQVETGCGERLPSVDTRPPRMRDSDAVIEIVLQESFDDDSAGNEAEEHANNDSDREDDQVDVVDEDGHQGGNEYLSGYPRENEDMPEDGSGKMSVMNTSHAEIDEEGDISSSHRVQSDQHPGSTGHAFSENAGSPREERWVKGKARSPHMSSGDSAFDRRSVDRQREDSSGSMEGKHSQDLSSPMPSDYVQEDSLERENDGEDIQPDIESEKGEENVNVVASCNASKEKDNPHSVKQQKRSSEVEPPLDREVDDGADLKASRSSDNSKATGSSRDHPKRRKGIDEEVVQNGRSTYLSDRKRNHGEGGQGLQRKDPDGRSDMERNYMLPKGRDEYNSHRDWDPHAANLFDAKSDSDRRKEYAEVGWPRRDEDPHGRWIRSEDARKQEHADDMVSRRRGKIREVDRSNKDEYLHSRKVMDNGSWRAYHDKDVGLRLREKDDVSKNRHEIIDDYYSKRRKDDEYARKDHIEKEEILLSHRASSSSRRKREREVFPSQRKREDQPRMRDTMDDHHSNRLKDESWVQRERAEQQREREEWYRTKHSYEELPRREREDGRAPVRSSRNVEDKTWIGHSRGGEEYKGHDKDAGRHSEQLKRRERIEEEANWQHRGGEDVYVGGNQFANEDKRSKHERSSSRNNHADDAYECQGLHEKKHKESVKKGRESEGHNSLRQSKRHQGDKSIAKIGDVKGLSDQAMSEYDTSYTRERKEDVSSDDELHNSKRGRSKLERWTSHKDRDYAAYSKSSLRIKDANKDKNTNSLSSSGVRDESAKKTEAGDSNQDLARGKDIGGLEGKGMDERVIDGRHLDTVEKLKRRSERFKLPLTSDKDPATIKKMESEPLPSSQNDDAANAEVKSERPPRKRRWINS